MKKHFLLLFLSLFALTVKAQWVQTNGINANKVYRFDTTSVLVYAGTNNGVYVSSDNGSRWSSRNGGILENKNVYSFLSYNASLFAGTNGIYRSMDNGISWTACNSGVPSSSGVYYQIRDFLLADTAIIAACQGSPGILLSVNNGGNWTPAIYSGPATNCLKHFGAYIFAGSNGGIYRSSDNGLTWNSSGTGMSMISINDFAVLDSSIFAGTTGGVYVSNDSGATWSLSGTGIPSTTINSMLSKGTDLFAAASDGFVYRSQDNGATWTNTSSGLPVGSSVLSLGLKNNIILIGKSTYGAYSSSNNGSSWSTTSNGLTTLSGNWVSCIQFNGNKMYLGTNDGTVGAANGMFLSDNNARTWSQLFDLWGGGSSDMYSIAVIGPKMFVGTPSGVYISGDSGYNWTSANTGLITGYLHTNTLFATNTRLFASTSGGVFLSDNNATSWNQALGGMDTMGAEAYVKNGSTIYTGSFFGVHTSTDNGTNWNAANTGIDSTHVVSLAIYGINIFAGTDNGMYFSADNGNSWSTINTGLPANPYISALIMDGTNIYAGVLGAGVYLSTDFGNTWIAYNTGAPYVDVTCFAIRGSVIYCGTNGFGILKRGLAPVVFTGVNNSVAKAEFLVFPNPFNDIATVSFGEEQRNCIIRVTDLYGNEVAKTCFNGQTYLFNQNGLKKGVYFMEIVQENKYSNVKKIVIQ